MNLTIKACPICGHETLTFVAMNDLQQGINVASQVMTEVQREKVTCTDCGETFTVGWYVIHSSDGAVHFQENEDQ